MVGATGLVVEYKTDFKTDLLFMMKITLSFTGLHKVSLFHKSFFR